MKLFPGIETLVMQGIGMFANFTLKLHFIINFDSTLGQNKLLVCKFLNTVYYIKSIKYERPWEKWKKHLRIVKSRGF